jgi:beta-mannanase
MAGMAVGRSGGADATPNGSVALGAFAPSLPWSFRDIDAFSSLVGSTPAIIHWFQDWVMDFDPAYMDEAISRGGMPLVTWEPWEFGAGLDQPEYSLRRILGGNHDEYVRKWAQAAVAWGKPFFLRFAHEMNGDWTTWSPGVNGNTAREFVAAWKRVHGIFRREGATNVRWVWSPVAKYEGSVPYKHVYPGDAYVNWFGISGYNWGNTREWSRWQSFSEIFGASYGTMRKIAPKKPIVISEVGCAEHGGDKAAWIRSAYLKEIPARFPRIRAISWFNANKENDWRVNSSSETLSAYKEVARNPIYQRSFL